jgi:uncharacterized protein YegP (UPF0339 family)
MIAQQTSRTRPRAARWSIAAILLIGACSDPSGSSSQPGGGKADSPQGEDIAASAMPILPERPGLIDLARTPASQWSARLVGPGGDIYLTSTAYAQEPSALNAILGIKENGVLPERYRTVTTADGCSLELRAANHKVIATGPSFATCAEAEAAIATTRDLVAGVVRFEAAVSGGARFDLWREAADGKWRFALRAAAQRTLLRSQAYSRRLDAVGGLTSVRANGKVAAQYKIIANADGTSAISLRAKNGQEIAAGGPHPTAAQAQAAIDETSQLLASERVGNPW